MKKILFSLLAVCLILSCNNKKQFEIVVNAEEGFELSENAVVALTYTTTIDDKDSLIKITAPFVDRKAILTSSVDDIYRGGLYLLESEDAPINGRPLTSFYLENTKYEITLTGDEKNPAQLVGGGEIQKVVDSLANVREEIFNSTNIDALRAAMKEDPDNKELRDSMRNVYNSISEQLENVGKDYLKLNPTSIYALFNNLDNANYISIDSLKQVVELFENDGKLIKSKAFERIKKLYDKRATLAPGNDAPDFTLNDVDGNPITLSDVYKENKITMIDFWASWCGPCRKFNPTLTQIYAKYHDKGL